MKKTLRFLILLLCTITSGYTSSEINPESIVVLTPIKYQKAKLDKKNILLTEKMFNISDIIIEDIAKELTKIKKVNSIRVMTTNEKSDTNRNVYILNMTKAKLENYIDSVTEETFYNMQQGITFSTVKKEKQYSEKIRFECRYEIMNPTNQIFKSGNVEVKVTLPSSPVNMNQRNWRSITIDLIHQIFDNTPFIEQKMDAHEFK